MSHYLEEAANQLRKVEQDFHYSTATGRREQRERLAEKFAELAAIDKGLLPQRLIRKETAAFTDTEL